MLIKQIDILVHPDYYQMMVPNLPLHERQLALREKWEQRFELLKEREDAILLYYSDITMSKIDQGLEDLSTISNKVEREEIERIKKVKAMLGNRLILYGWFATPSLESLTKTFVSRDFSYIPQETKIHAYGEILEMCVWAWSNYTACTLDIPYSNIEFSREESLTNDGSKEIFNWRVFKMDSSFLLV